MDNWILVIVCSLAAGIAIPVGGLIARFEHFQSVWLEEEFRHGVMAFGAGALLSAIALVLVPEGIQNLSVVPAVLFFIMGSFSFMGLDIILKKIDTPASQLAAMLADFIPESIALGAAFATGNNNAYLLAALIALQNLPEGFNAFSELNSKAGFKPAKLLLIFCILALLGPAAGITGYLWLGDYPHYLSAIMLFASGGILYSIFQDIAPQVKLEQHWFPPMGAVLGFVLGMVGFMFTTN